MHGKVLSEHSSKDTNSHNGRELPMQLIEIQNSLLPTSLAFSIFQMSGLRAASFFGRTSKVTQVVYTRYLREKLLSEGSLANNLLKTAESNGVKLNYHLLYRLSLDAQGPFHYLSQLTPDTIWPLAALCGDESWLKENLKNDMKTVRCCYGKDVLFYLSFGGHLTIIEKDYKDVLDNSQLKELGNTENFFIAAAAGNFHVCDFIKRFGKNLADVNTYEAREIHFACQYGDLQRIKNLQEYSSNISIFQHRDGMGNLPIHYATKGGKMDVIAYIANLDPHMAVEQDSETGNSLLHIAAENGRSLLIDPLIGFGCDPKAININGLTPLEESSSGNWECFLKLLPHIGKYQEPPPGCDNYIPFIAAFTGTIDFLKNYISEYGRRCLNYRNSKGSTIAHELMSSCNICKLRTMVNDYKISLTGLDHQKNTPLLNAAIEADQTSSDLYWNFLLAVVTEFRQKLGDNIFDQQNDDQVSLRSLIEKNHKEELFQKAMETTGSRLML